MTLLRSFTVPFDLKTVTTVFLAASLLFVLLCFRHRRYVHPLHAFPGPFLSSVSDLPHAYHAYAGTLHPWLTSLHSRHGPFVRIRPNQLSIIDAQAWRDIFLARPQFPKHITMPEPGVASIATADDAGHARHRKLLAHAFSEGALREQEPILQLYVNLLIDKLGEHATNQGRIVDLVEWYTFVAFDIVADLTFGESFHNLDRAENHPWVKAVEADMGMAVRLSQTYAVPGLSAVVGWLLPWVLGSNHHAAYQYSAVKTQERLERGQERPDFMTHILRHNDEKGLTREEIDADVSTLINAGSETTSTVLAGCTYYMLRPENEEALQRLVDEVRLTFNNAEEITQEAVRKLEWMDAVVWEALRLYPPLPIALPRVVPDGGTMVAGCWVPGGTIVGIPQRVANLSPEHFAEPLCFRPQRWLKENKRDPKFANDMRDVVQPFHVGPRNCLGRHLAHIELRLVLAMMIWHFDMELADAERDWAKQKIWLVYDKTPLMVRLKPRRTVHFQLDPGQTEP